MTIEKKVRDILLKLMQDWLDILLQAKREEVSIEARNVGTMLKVNQASQAILALIKPMSRERLIKLIADYKCGYPFVHSDGDSYIGDENAEGISDTILAEWEKGLK